MKRRTFLGLVLAAAPASVQAAQYTFSDPQLYARKMLPTNALPTNALAAAWAERVVVNGGAAPSANTVAAVSAFCDSLDAASLTPKMKAVNCFVPDNLIAATTPLISVIGNDPWTNANFVDADLTINGLKGNGSDKYLNSGIHPDSLKTAEGQTDSAVAVYIAEGAIEDKNEFGCSDLSAGSLRLYGHTINKAGWAMNYQDAVALSTLSTDVPHVGYICVDRTATERAIYMAGIVSHYPAVSSLTFAGGAPWMRPLAVFASNEAGSIVNYSSKRLSFVSMSNGLTASESSNLFSFVQALRERLGGGYVNRLPSLGLRSLSLPVAGPLMFIDVTANPSTIWKDTERTQAALPGDTVRGITDLSGNNNHWSQPTASIAPALSMIGNYNALNFFSDGAHCMLFTSAMSTIRTVFWVAHEAAGFTGGYQFLLGHGTAYDFHANTPHGCFETYGKVNYLRIDKVEGAIQTARPLTLKVITAQTRANASASEFSKDRGNAYAQSSWNGALVMLVCYDSILTAQQISDTEDAIKAYYGMV